MLKSLIAGCLLIFLSWLIPTNTLKAQVETPILHCVNIQSNDGSIQITWQPSSPNQCGVSFTAYNIYVALSETGPFSLLATITNEGQTTYNDSMSDATNTLYFYVTKECAGIESPPSQTVSTDFPIAPPVTLVSVLPDNTVQLVWENSTSPETFGYIIYQANDDGTFSPIDTIYVSQNSNFYGDIDAQPDLYSEAYKIAAFDSCSLEPGPTSETHSTIYLEYDVDACNGEVRFEWNGYDAWNIEEYRLVEVLPSGLNQLIVTLDPLLLAYTLEGLTTATCFALEAVKSGSNGTTKSLSNAVCIDPDFVESPDFIYMTNATINNDGASEIEWIIDNSIPINILNIQRGISDSSDLSYLTNFSPAALPFEYTDAAIQSNFNNYVYQIEHVDECGQQAFSTIAQTILLTGQDQFGNGNQINWTPFYITHGTVTAYTIYRADFFGPNDMGSFTALDATSPSELSYTDIISGLGSNGIGFCYKIEATYTLNLPNGVNETNTSVSNVLCISQASQIHVPNAFVPQGQNNIFKPIITYPNADAYEMFVVNRWGEIMFTTTNPDEGWNGEYKSDIAPQGVYSYVIKMTSFSGYQLERKGTVLLIR
ncbi:MAG: gliding motility-associated C-terminal domain-containing protein [Chitinophagales bacterium]